MINVRRLSTFRAWNDNLIDWRSSSRCRVRHRRFTDESVGHLRDGQLFFAALALNRWRCDNHKPLAVSSGPLEHAFAGPTKRLFAALPDSHLPVQCIFRSGRLGHGRGRLCYQSEFSLNFFCASVCKKPVYCVLGFEENCNFLFVTLLISLIP
jgi:hypothetical protein